MAVEKTIEKKVKIALIEQDMSYADLADELGISSAYISDLVKGKRNGKKAQERLKTIKKRLNIY